jgi:hypothetical protein
MPVIECSCGMVMSVPAKGPRGCCIRCGGVEFQILARGENRRRHDRLDFAIEPAQDIHPTLALTTIGMLELIRGSCI